MWEVREGAQGWLPVGLFSRMESGAEGAALGVESQRLSIDCCKCEVRPSLQLGLQTEGVQRGRFQRWTAAPHAGGDRGQRAGPGQEECAGGQWRGGMMGEERSISISLHFMYLELKERGVCLCQKTISSLRAGAVQCLAHSRCSIKFGAIAEDKSQCSGQFLGSTWH